MIAALKKKADFAQVKAWIAFQLRRGPYRRWFFSGKMLMRLVVTSFVAMICLLLAGLETASAQMPQQGVTVTFNNASKGPVIVKGYTVVNNTRRPGQLLPISKGGKAYESGVPAGFRYYTVFDAINPSRVLLRDFPVPIQNRDVSLVIMNAPNDPTRVVIAPGQ
jgi:hypothetical protein